MCSKETLVQIPPSPGSPYSSKPTPHPAAFGGRRTLRCFLRGRACRAPRKVLGRQILRLGIHHFGRGAIKGNALVMVEHRMAVQRRHFPAAEHAQRVRKRPALCRGDLTGGVDRQRPNVFVVDRKRERPFFSELSELFPVVLDTAISLNPIRHVRSHNSG